MKCYPKYKSSNIPWIGDIPEHWETKKIKYCTIFINGYSFNSSEYTDEGIPVIRIGDIRPQIDLQNCKRVSYNYSKTANEFRVIKGDILLALTGATIGKSSIFDSDDEALLNQRVAIIRSQKKLVNQGFIKYIIDSYYFREHINLECAGGAQENIGKPEVGFFSLTLPSPEEQLQIASYLDIKTQKIDKLITNKQKQIELLKEERQAIINNAVTGRIVINNVLDDDEVGKDAGKVEEVGGGGAAAGEVVGEEVAIGGHVAVAANVEAAHAAAKAAAEKAVKAATRKVKYKDSGIPWLGEIPEHWEVKKLKYNVYKVSSGVTPEGGASVYMSEGIPFLRSQNIHFDGLKLDDIAFISEEIDDKMKNSRITSGDVLLNITGASIGRCYYIEPHFGKGNVNQHVCIIRPLQKKLLTKFLYFFLWSDFGQLQISFYQMGANREGLNFEQIKNFYLPIPSIEKQLKIIEIIEEELKTNRLLIYKVEKEIALLQEYRTALISEVVTGKVDVRN